MLQKNIVESKKINTFTIIINYIIMNVDAPVATAARIKKSRLKQSTKAIYNDILKRHFRKWLQDNSENVIVKKHRNVIYCDELMELMGLEKPLKKNIQRDWKLKFPTMTIF